MKKFLLAALFLLGCSGLDHNNWTGNVCVVPDFSSYEDNYILNAAKEWQTRSDNNVDMSILFLNNHDLQGCDGVMERKDLTFAPGSPWGQTVRSTRDDTPTWIYIDPIIYVSDDQDLNDAFYQTVLHEMGHYLGANHSPYCSDIMYWKYTGHLHLSDGDVNQLWHPYPFQKYDYLTYCQEDLDKAN